MVFIIKDVRVNREIHAKEVRVIDPDGKQLGILPLFEALKAAQSFDLDLVEVSPKSNPPVCKIMDYGKFKYQQSKKAHEAKKRQVIHHIKEVKLRPKTEEHDFQFKLKHIERFLKDGNKTKVTIVFRGREMAYPEMGKNILIKIVEGIKDFGKVEQPPKLEGRNLTMVLAPIPGSKSQTKEEKDVKQEREKIEIS